ncbi:MAG: methylenetetrahydrofolate reductase [Patescibacteria group bacterium]|jgi:methylenetetrahydrofolate reductase (NADPH)
MQIIDILKNRTKTLISLEITPPEKGRSVEEIFTTVNKLLPYQPAFINITYHQQQIVYEEQGDKIVKIPRRKKPGTIGICAALYNKFKIETVPHLICGGFSKYETEDALIDLNYLGFKNLFALRGDPLTGMKKFIPESAGHSYAAELVEQISHLNKGKYLEEIDNAIATNFCVGVAGYPEKHYEAPNIDADIKHLKTKIDNGASYIITQMVFSLEAFKAYVKKVRLAGITVPIIPGIKILTNKKQLDLIPSLFHIDLPQVLVQAIKQAKDNKAAQEVGIQFTINFCQELIKLNVPCLHFYTMGKGDVVAETLKRLQQQALI